MRRPPETLDGPSLVLRRVSAQYASELSSAVARSLPELRLFMDWAQHDPATPEAFAEFLEASDREWESDRAYGYHVFVAATDELIGGCGLMRRRGPGAIEIADRGTAITTALGDLAADDVLLIAGKGHENFQLVGNETLPFSDSSVARNAITQMVSRGGAG